MSQRGKRQASRLDDAPVATKRRKVRSLAVAEEEEATLEGWTARPNSDLKISAIYNRSSSEAPAEFQSMLQRGTVKGLAKELFRKDLISAMKLPDSEPLTPDEYWIITDPWKQEWEKGVQVPVNPDSLPGPTVTVVTQAVPACKTLCDFKLPKSKYIRITKDEGFKTEEHFLSSLPAKADKACSYDLDNFDIAWLKIVNGERASMGYYPIREDQLERVIEELEIRCWDKVQAIVKSEEGLGIEFDENVICDVCRSPDSEEGNEMVFCDCCNICVHQACYGITTIPSGSWLCRTCDLGQRPECVLCPNKGGAMKCTRSGQKWAHVSCALWIPEVSIGCVEKMEPITKISSIPQSRWALICVLCRERVGACIQCSVKTCKIAYHVTCAFKHGLEMKAIIEDENADDGVKLRSYCEKHSNTTKKERCSSASDDEEFKKKKRKDMTSEEKNQARAAKLQEIEAEFDKHVNPNDVTTHYDVDVDGIVSIYNYWVLKRRAGNNKPLLAPRSEDDFLSRQQEQADLEKMKMFVQLRQDLERVRNLCYMVSRREKLSRTYFRMREQTFHKQVSVLSEPSYTLSSTEITAVKESNHGPSIYDRLYSHPNAPDLSTDFETVLARIAGVSSPTPEDKSKIDLNGMRKKSDNSYRSMFNGDLDRRRNVYASMSSGSDTDIKRPIRMGVDTPSSTDDKPPKLSNKSTKNLKEKKLSKKRTSRVAIDTSTEDEDLSKPSKKHWDATARSKSLQQMEKEMIEKTGSDDSDDLITFPSLKKESERNISNIYSDSDSDSSKETNDTHTVRTKAAVKEFSSQSKNKKGSRKSPAKFVKSLRNEKEVKLDSSLEDDYHRDKENIKTSKKKSKDKDAVSSDLIVPQRQAAKKASENIRCFQVKTKPDQVLSEQEASKTSPNEDNKLKSKPLKHKRKEPLKTTGSCLKDSSKCVREDKDKIPSDIYDFDKDLCSDGQDIIAYVPQRQAAKKAAEHIKSGMQKPGAENEQDNSKNKISDLIKPKKEVEVSKTKKESETDKNKKPFKVPEVKSRKMPKSSVSSSSSSSTTSSSSGSSTSSSSSSSESCNEEEEDRKKVKLPLDKRSLFEVPKDQEKKLKLLDKKTMNKKLEVNTEKSKIITRTSSSSSSSESEESSSKRHPIKKVSSVTSKSKTPERKPAEVRKDDSDPKSVASKKLRKTPDKKLKTSDGRPELEFQQPPTEREESSSRTEEKSSRRSKSSSNSGEGRGHAQTKHGSGHHHNKIQSPPAENNPRSRSHTPRREDTKADSNNKKESMQGRKRKSDDCKKHSPSPDIDQTKTSPSDSNVEEKLIKGQVSPILGRKTDRKIESHPKDSPSKKPESDSLVSTLEREMAERRAGRDSISSKSNSKKSLDKLFKLVKENEKKDYNSLVNDKIIHKTFEKSEKSSKESSKSDKGHTKEEGYHKNYKNEEKSWSKSNDSKNSPAKRSPGKQKSLFSPELDHLDRNKSRNKKNDQIHYEECKEELSSEENKMDISSSSLPILSPMLIHPENGQKTNYGTLPHLDKVENLEMSDFQVADPDILEPKKITSRTSSLSAPYQHRSIFSPQPPKDSGVAELFDFESEMLAVDESVNEDGISIVRDSEEMRGPPISFSFMSNDIFGNKEDSKEDSARETLNLVEKLRMEYAKKTQADTVESLDPTTSDSQSVLTVSASAEEETQHETEKMQPKVHEILSEEEPKLDSSLEDQEPILIAPSIPDEIKQNTQLDLVDHKALDPDIVERTINMMKPIMDDAALHIPGEPHLLHIETDKHEIPQYEPSEHYGYQAYGLSLEVGKVPGREKLDRSNSAQADERWVPPSSSVPPSVHSYEHVPSPYRNKWADSELMPSRHSSSSSASSTSSSSQREDMEQPKHDDLVIPAQNLIPELLPFQGPHSTMPYNPSCALANAGPFHYTDPQFQVQLFPPSSCPQLPPFPSPGAGIFSHNFTTPYAAPPTLVTKQEETIHMPPPSTAAFTSSSHNMALTAAMVSPIQPIIQEPPLTPLPFPPETCQQLPPPESPAAIVEPFNHEPPPSVPPVQLPPEEPPIPKLTLGKKSPAKPTRTSARCIAQQAKSPTKSPGKSPRQSEAPLGKGRGGVTGGKRGRPPGSTRGGSRGRGRGGRGRGRGAHAHNVHSDPNTIQSKLVGTVYDFDIDDDEGDSFENLRAMRERRKSSEVHDRKSSDGSLISKDSSQSPKFTSPSHHNAKQRSGYSSDLRELRPPSPVTDSSLANDDSGVDKSRVEIVQPLLPGPVDMRTYSSFDTNTSSGTYHNHLLEPFAAGTTNEQHVSDYVEDLDEELQSLTSNKASKAIDKGKNDHTSVVPSDSSTTATFNDSRNQLKVKIKGPFLDANYTSTVTPQTQPPLQNITPMEGTVGGVGVANGVPSTGTSNLRRMRKKELLRQYWNQDMNMDEASSSIVPAIPAQDPPRTGITIPKAVASMTSIPTREDYKAVVDANMEKKRKKEKSGHSTNLGSYAIPIDITDDNERQRGSGSLTTESSHPFKRRVRAPKSNPPPVAVAPKLKIKIGGEDGTQVSVATLSEERKNLRVRPPKKRLSSMPTPTVEEMKRESMKFRKMVMAGFDEEEKVEEIGRKKRKRQAEAPSVHVIADETTPKIIIRFGKRPEESVTSKIISSPLTGTEPPASGSPHSERTSECSSLRKARTSKTTPIRLKLSRCEEGYVMKVPSSENNKTCSEISVVESSEVEEPPSSHPPPVPLPLSKDCEVR